MLDAWAHRRGHIPKIELNGRKHCSLIRHFKRHLKLNNVDGNMWCAYTSGVKEILTFKVLKGWRNMLHVRRIVKNKNKWSRNSGFYGIRIFIVVLWRDNVLTLKSPSGTLIWLKSSFISSFHVCTNTSTALLPSRFRLKFCNSKVDKGKEKEKNTMYLTLRKG
jgi:hypothetical protein